MLKVFVRDGVFEDYCPPSNVMRKVSEHYLYHQDFFIPIAKDFKECDRKTVVDKFMESTSYELVGRIERDVHKVTRDNKFYVLKTINCSHDIELEMLMMNIRHKVKLEQFWVKKTKIYMIFPWYEKGDLFNLIDRCGETLTNCMIHSVAKQLIEFLTDVHERSIVYVDLKLENILIEAIDLENNSITIKVCDFGLCKFEGNEHFPEGSPEYMPPEMAKAYVVYRRSMDIWSFGAVISNLFHRGSFATFGAVETICQRTIAYKPYFGDKIPAEYLGLLKKIFVPAVKRPTIRQIEEEVAKFEF